MLNDVPLQTCKLYLKIEFLKILKQICKLEKTHMHDNIDHESLEPFRINIWNRFSVFPNYHF